MSMISDILALATLAIIFYRIYDIYKWKHIKYDNNAHLYYDTHRKKFYMCTFWKVLHVITFNEAQKLRRTLVVFKGFNQDFTKKVNFTLYGIKFYKIKMVKNNIICYGYRYTNIVKERFKFEIQRDNKVFNFDLNEEEDFKRIVKENRAFKLIEHILSKKAKKKQDAEYIKNVKDYFNE